MIRNGAMGLKICTSKDIVHKNQNILNRKIVKENESQEPIEWILDS